MANISASLGGVTLTNINIPFIEKPLENATDVTTLDFTTYTDFSNNKKEWEINFKKLDETTYNQIRDVYELQFINGTYPNFVCSYYDINTHVRMYINDKDIRQDGCYIYGVTLRLVMKTTS